MKRKSLLDRFIDAVLVVLMLFVIVVCAFPFWNQMVLSVAEVEQLYSIDVAWYPKSINLDSYRAMLHYSQLWRGYANTIARTVLGTFLSLLVTAMMAYPLSKKDLPFNKSVTTMLVITMLFGGGLIPSYLLITQTLRLQNTIWAMVLPGLVGAYNVFIIRNFFASLPPDIEESAVLDGAGYVRIFLQFILPLSVPVLMTVGLWIAVGHWQAWYDYMLYMPEPEGWGLGMVIRKILIQNRPQDALAAVQRTYGTMVHAVDQRQLEAAVIMVSVLPMLIIYPFIQRYFTKGIMLGAVKG